MSRPRQVLRGKTYLVTRRCTQRQFLLLPTAEVRLVFLYCLALAQAKTGVLVHAVTVMSNHYHLIATDPDAKLPEFIYILHKHIALCLNVHYDRGENLWSTAQASFVALEDDEALLAKTVYTITNPVEAGLVRSHRDWPGICFWTPGTYKVKRPSWFFNPDGSTPASSKFEITPIPLTSVTLPRDVQETLGQAVAVREEALRKLMKAERRTFLGVRAIRRQRHTDTPTSSEPRRTLSPRVAARDKWRRIEALNRLRSFHHDYREARQRWINGERDVVFPAGCYKLRVEFGVRCADD